MMEFGDVDGKTVPGQKFAPVFYPNLESSTQILINPSLICEKWFPLVEPVNFIKLPQSFDK